MLPALRWERLTTNGVALGLVGIGLIAVASYVVWGGTADWTPNIATEAFSIAVTILIVDRIVQRERRRRVEPRRKRALDVLSRAFIKLAFNTYTDIVFTNVMVDVRDLDIPSDPVEIFDFWVQKQDTNDTPRPRKGGRSLLLSQGLEFVRGVQRVADADRELLPTDLVVAIDNLEPIFTGDSLYDLAEEVSEREARGMDDWLLFTLIPAVGRVGQALQSVAGDRLRPLWATSTGTPD